MVMSGSGGVAQVPDDESDRGGAKKGKPGVHKFGDFAIYNDPYCRPRPHLSSVGPRRTPPVSLNGQALVLVP
jgi:hypothetical protein